MLFRGLRTLVSIYDTVLIQSNSLIMIPPNMTIKKPVSFGTIQSI